MVDKAQYKAFIHAGMNPREAAAASSGSGLAALDTHQEYAVEAGGTVNLGNSQDVIHTVTAAFPNVNDDISIPAIGQPCVVTVNTTGLYILFMSSCGWTTSNGTTGTRAIMVHDGDGNTFFVDTVLASQALALGRRDFSSQLLLLTSGLQMTLKSQLSGSPTANESATAFLDFYRVA